MTLDNGSAGEVEFKNVDPKVNADSCMEIWARRVFDVSAGSCWSQVYDSTANAVTTAENRPAYDMCSVQGNQKYQKIAHKNE